jgi:hypothetical protein
MSAQDAVVVTLFVVMLAFWLWRMVNEGEKE